MAGPYTPGPPPRDALDWFRAKGLKPSFDWADVWREEHAVAFTVAKMLHLDLLADVRAEVDRALAEGLTFHDFQKRLAPVLQEKGWWGVKELTDPLTGETKQVQLGSPRRLRVIYDTNLRTARAAGQWARIRRTQNSHPYLLYTVGPSREHRPEHLSWHGTLLPVDDPWWKTHFVPNGWGCKCRIRQISRREHDRLVKTGLPVPPNAATQELDPETGLPTGRRVRATVPVKTTAPKLSTVEWVHPRTGTVMDVPRGIDPGWDYNPGEGRLAHLQKLLAEKERGFERAARPAALARRLAGIEEGYRNQAVERMAAVDEAGTLLLEASGDFNSVALDRDDWQKLAGATVTHYHTVVTSFSPEDIALASRYRLREIRAVDDEFVYVMEPPPTGWDAASWADRLKPRFEVIEAEVFGEFFDRLGRGDISQSVFNRELYHVVWERFSQATGVRYERRRR